ncbi:MAG: AMP-binding protein [bacterium]
MADFPLRKWAKQASDTPFIYFQEQIITYSDADDLLTNYVATLSDYAIQKSSRVIICCEHKLHLLFWMLACWNLGLIAVPIHPKTPLFLREKTFNDCSASLLIDDHFSPLSCSSSPFSFEFSTEQIACLIQTSGTTDLPKLAGLTFSSLLSSAYASQDIIPLSPSHCWLLSLPLYHVSGLGILFRVLVNGASLCLDSFSYSTLSLPYVTHCSCVLPQAHELISDNSPAPSQLQCLLLGGSFVETSILDSLYSQSYPLFITYGCSEFSSQIATSMYLPNSSLSLNLLPHVSVKTSQSHHLFVKGKSLFSGYWNPRYHCLELPLDENAYFNTEDKGRITDRSLAILSNPDSRLISGGENIDTREIERALYELDGVRSVSVSFIPHPKFGQRPIACISYLGTPPPQEWFTEQLASKLLPFKIPRILFK